MAFCPKKTLILSSSLPFFTVCSLLTVPNPCPPSVRSRSSSAKWNECFENPPPPFTRYPSLNHQTRPLPTTPAQILPISRRIQGEEEGEEDVKGSSFYVVRDDLLHRVVNGNKARKLDALIPILQQQSAIDVVTCGGCQSAHAAALAVSCAERGVKSQLLLRGEQPEIPTGYNLVSLMYGNVTHVARPMYARREEMFIKHANTLVSSSGCIIHIDDIVASASDASDLSLDRSMHVLPQVNAEKGLRRVVIVSEGAGDVFALLGIIRLVKYLSQAHAFGKEREINFVVDTGTGTTAVGLALGAHYLRLPWKVTAIMLADTIERYKEKERCLISDFWRIYQFESLGQTIGNAGDNIVHWIERIHSRK